MVGANDCPMVMVEWVDSVRPAPSWQHLCDFECGPAISCASVGWLIHDGEDVKALAPNMGEIDNADQIQASGIIRIPTVSITRIVRLREGFSDLTCQLLRR